MTNARQFLLKTGHPSIVGFDTLFDEIESILNSDKESQKYPPHNVIKVDDYKYVVEVATAGFKQEELIVEVVDGKLVISGEKFSTEDDVVPNYLHKGISSRSFFKTIRIPETVVVHGAQYIDGVLRVGLENVIPEHKKPRTVEIGSEVPLFKQELLTE